MCCIAVMCHELGHLVGLPDLYDYSRYTWGIGYWGLMCYGAWGAGGNTPWSPSHMEAWSKVEAGFVQPTLITQNTYDLRIPPVETNQAIYKVWRGGRNTDTCFYLENRQQQGFDSPLPGPGLLIFHIDPAQGGSDDLVDLEEDSTFHLDNGNGVRPDPHVYHQLLGDTSDALPGNWNRTAFDSATVPSSRDRLGRSTGVCVRNIRLAGDTIICDIIVDPEHVALAEGRTAPATTGPDFSVTPNPARSRARVRLAPGPLDRPATISIFDAAGRELLNGLAASHSTELPALAPGAYFVRLATGRRTAVRRLVITAGSDR